jgi:hypothetical protein
MSAQTLKMKGKLEKIKKGREVFEEKKRNLDMEMVKSRIGMMNLTKGLSKKEGEGLSGRMSIDQPDGKRYFMSNMIFSDVT